MTKKLQLFEKRKLSHVETTFSINPWSKVENIIRMLYYDENPNSTVAIDREIISIMKNKSLLFALSTK